MAERLRLELRLDFLRRRFRLDFRLHSLRLFFLLQLFPGLGFRRDEFQFVRELLDLVVHVHGNLLDVESDPVVSDQRGNRHKQAEHGCEQGSRNARGQSLDIRLASHRHFGERKHDAPHRAEQAHERTDADRRHQNYDLVLQFHDLIGDGFLHRGTDHVDFDRSKRTGVRDVRSRFIAVELSETGESAFIDAGDRRRVILRAGTQRHHVFFAAEFLQETSGPLVSALESDALLQHQRPCDNRQQGQPDNDPLSHEIGVKKRIRERPVGDRRQGKSGKKQVHSAKISILRV